MHFNWLIKTDINGDVLWEKTIGEASSFIGIFSIDMNDAGELFFAGATTFFDTYNDPIISKLNPCGEKEWCKVFYSPENFDYAYSVLATDDGGCIAILRYTGDEELDRICLVKLSGVGELLWKECYNSPDTSLINELERSKSNPSPISSMSKRH